MKCVLRTRALVLSLTLESSSPDLNEELFDPKIASLGACFSKSANVDSLSGKISGTASKTIQQSFTAAARSSNASYVPACFGWPGSKVVNDGRFSLIYLMASWRDFSDGSRTRTLCPAATKQAAMRRPNTPPPRTQIGLVSHDLGGDHRVLIMKMRRSGLWMDVVRVPQGMRCAVSLRGA